ncbi:DNA-directed RNA polymerase subunit F [archaeon SCG-AAA382B04]|nr:DNA-directed RNA polymerase subunit F [archaeon SCG-AAA382B04]
MKVKEVLEDEPIPISEAGEILKEETEKRREEERDKGYAQRRAFDHIQKFSKQDSEKAKELYQKLVEHNKVTPELAVKMTDLLPKEKDLIRALYSKERFALNEDTIEELLDIISEYRE